MDMNTSTDIDKNEITRTIAIQISFDATNILESEDYLYMNDTIKNNPNPVEQIRTIRDYIIRETHCVPVLTMNGDNNKLGIYISTKEEFEEEGKPLFNLVLKEED